MIPGFPLDNVDVVMMAMMMVRLVCLTFYFIKLQQRLLDHCLDPDDDVGRDQVHEAKV